MTTNLSEALARKFDVLQTRFPHTSKNLLNLKKIAQSERLRRITHRHGCFWVQHAHGALLYSGLRPRIKEVYFPTTEEGWSIGQKRPVRKVPGRQLRKKKIKKEPGAKERAPSRRCYKWGKDHGACVHDGLESYIRQVLLGKKAPKQWAQEAARRKIDDPCVFSLLQFLVDQQIFPVCPELPVFDEKSNVATKIDLLGLDVEGKICTIEWKTGYASEAYRAVKADQMLEASMGDMQNCPLNRHFLQAMLSTMILKKSFPFVHVSRVLVVRVVPATQRVYDYNITSECAWARDPARLCRFYREVTARAKRNPHPS